MTEGQRHEAIGSRGEACIIVSQEVTNPSGERDEQFSLACGERLRRTETDGEFETLHGNRKFRLRSKAA